jgi:hypothetical protein
MKPEDIVGGKRHSAYDPKNDKAVPALVEELLGGIIKPNPPEKEFYVGDKPHAADAIIEGIVERKTIIEEAKRHHFKVSDEKLQRVTDAIFNHGFSMAKLQKLAVMDSTSDTIETIQEILETASVTGLPTVEDVEAVAVVSRAILHYFMTHHGGGTYKKESTKTPFQAWRIKESLVEFLATNSIFVINPSGPDNKTQVDQFYGNFSTSELILWNHNIWEAAIRGSEEFLGTPITKDIVDQVIPMFWQYDTPFMMPKNYEERFMLKGNEYECTGFVILPFVEEHIKVNFPEEAVTVKEKKEGKYVITEIKDNQPAKDAMNEALANGLRFARRGISIAIIFTPLIGSTPEVRFFVPLYEGEEIEGHMVAALLAGLKFLSMDYVAKDDVGISKKELKQDRPLFKKVRHNKVQVPPIKIINLRKSERRTRKQVEEENKTKRQYKCHFMVDPHWKKQWYPSEGRHHVIRILSYVKGDLTKPFKPPREKVYRAVR